ncbi:MAG: O-antigen ligase domain-containing protein [Planctomycetes bacterium]|nr:O-antigen ligase domain-containing protein [Planctomycetota bacterium]
MTLADLALILMFPLGVLLFAVLSPVRAVVGGFLIGYLFLPQTLIKMPGVLPDYDRTTAMVLGVLAGVCVFDLGRLLSYRPSWIDLPALVWVVGPFATSMSNGLGPYEGVSSILDQSLEFGIPYLLARVYFSDAVGVRTLVGGLVLGAMLYIPLCLYEVRMSPQLHRIVYGMHQHRFAQTYRLGGWRPTVFLQHGLAVGMWMSMGTLISWWVVISGSFRRSESFLVPALAVLAVTTLLVKSLGALVLMLCGGFALYLSRTLGVRWLVVALTLIPPSYYAVRISGAWTGDRFVTAIRKNVSADRAQSVEFRLENETLLIDRALKRPLLGWGRWGRSMLYAESGKKITTADGRWILAFGRFGYVGLCGLTLAFLLPTWLWLSTVPPPLLGRADLAPATGLCVLLSLFAIDSLLNAMPNPFMPMAAGALGGFALLVRRAMDAHALNHALSNAAGWAALGERRWSAPELARREQEALHLVMRLDPEEQEAWRDAIRMTVLGLETDVLNRFLELPWAEQQGVIRRFTDSVPSGLGPVEDFESPADSELGPGLRPA